MAEKNLVCEEIEVAIYSDTALTDEQKNHIESCESCKALLSQITKMKAELSCLDVTKIKAGEIADRVMSNIRNQKLKASRPKFRITHHLGTAAAVAIILTAALIIKNPSDKSGDYKVNYDNSSNVASNELKYAEFGTQNDGVLYADEEEWAEEAVEEAVVEETAEAEMTDGTAESQASDASPKLMMAKAPESRKKEFAEPEALNDVYVGSSSDGAVAFYSPNTQSVSDVATEEYEDVQSDDANYEEAIIGNAGGKALGGADSSENYKYANETTESQTQAPSNSVQDLFMSHFSDGLTESNIFSGVEFLDGEENLDFNISLANSRLAEVSDVSFRFTREWLQEIIINTNEEFLEYILNRFDIENVR